MVAILLGTNRIVDCPSILSMKGQPLLSIKTAPLRLSLQTPVDYEGVKHVHVEDNIPQDATVADPESVNVVAQETSVSLVYRDQILIFAVQIHPDTILLHLELRPLGLNVHTDPTGLHVGTNLLAKNMISNSPSAINLE